MRPRHEKVRPVLQRVVGILAGHLTTIGQHALTGRLRILRKEAAVVRGMIGSPPLGSGVDGGK